MKQEQLSRVLQGCVIAILGVLIAIYGAGSVIDAYFGVAGIIGGSVLALFGIFLIAKKQPLSFGLLFLSAALITCSIGLFTHYVSLSVLIEFMVLIVMALGAAAVLYGVYAIAKKEIANGIIFAIFGAICIALSALYMGIPDFRTAFWIVTGILMAVFGILTIVFVFFEPKRKAK